MRRKKRKFRKLFILFAIIFITTIILIFEKYAWFVGITSAVVDQFTVSVAAGRYQIISNKLTNSPTEQDGYIVFDLFIRNTSTTGTPQTTYDASAEEEIYLTANSNVYAPTSGVNNEGLANSVRVGFFEIGRVAATASQSTITGITCSTSPSLCASSSNLNTKRTNTWNI